VPPLRSVVADRDAQRLLLPDQHHQPFAPRDPRVDQVALEQHVVLGSQRDHHRWKFRSLRLVDRDGISWGNFIQFTEIVFHNPVIEANHNLMLDCIYPLNGSHVPVEHILVVVVLRLDDLVPGKRHPNRSTEG
jgi:hypothetical protein